jgi:hypothetical protein
MVGCGELRWSGTRQDVVWFVKVRFDRAGNFIIIFSVWLGLIGLGVIRFGMV